MTSPSSAWSVALAAERNPVTGTSATGGIGVGDGVGVGLGDAIGLGDARPAGGRERPAELDSGWIWLPARWPSGPMPTKPPASTAVVRTTSTPRVAEAARTGRGRRFIRSEWYSGAPAMQPARWMADPTGFEPAISSVTGWHVWP